MTNEVVYVVLAHDPGPQTTRLVHAILRSSPAGRVLVALDGRGDAELSISDDPRIEVLVHGYASDWGSWELVEATLEALRHARDRYDPDLVVLISGSDYPVIPLGDWEAAALAEDAWHGEAGVLAYRPRWGRQLGQGDDRLTRYTYRWFRPPWADWARRAPRWWWRVHAAVALRAEPIFSVRVVARGRGLHYGFRRARTPFGPAHACFIGSQWFAAPRRVLADLLDEELAAGGRLRRFYRRSVIPDESAIVTALEWRSPKSSMPPVTHVRWDVTADRPVVWTVEDLPEILQSGAPFCRKVDLVRSASLLEELDRRIA